ncbi:MAG: response regulator [Bacteroidales bacterium]|nr:response regulator [Bacteroidales bacterium]
MAKILAIDDIQDNLTSIKAIITDAFPDIEVFTALSGSQGVELAKRVTPDIILLDILMPGMDGYEVCKRVKSDPNLEDIPVVFVTALKESRQNRILALEAGAEAFLTKPIDETEMISQIKAMLKIRAANVFKRDEKIRLEDLVKSRTQELERELSDRIKADAEVRNSEEKHRALVNQMQLGLAVHEIILNEKGEAVDYLFLDVNPAYERVTGLKREDVIGRRVLEVLPKTEKIWIEKYGKVALTGEPVSFESYASEFGRYYNVTAYKSRDSEFAVIVEDITDKKAVEEKLKTSDKIFNHVLDMICIAGYDGYFKELNPSWERELGWSTEELLSKPYSEFVHPLDRDSTASVSKTIIDGREVYRFENRYICKDGSVKWLSWNSYPYKEENIMFGVARNITKDKRDEQIQQVLYEVSRSAANATNLEDILKVVRSELCKVMDANNFFVASYNPETDKLKKIIFLDDNDSFEEWEAKDTLSGLVIKTEKSILTSKEEIIQFAKEYGINLTGTLCESWLGVPIFVEHKAIGVMVVQSYTDKNAYDAKSMRLMEMIAHEIAIVMLRVSMIENLIRSKERAEESDRLKTAFLANMSHEIRTPMNGIMGFLQLLNDVDLTSDDRQYYFEIINKSGERLLSTINDIIEISKIESGQLNVIYSNVNIKEILNFHYKFFINQTEKKGISLNLKNVEEIADVIVGDEHILDGILTNLIKNAIKFTDSGEIEIGAFLKDESIIFYVRDTGIGISKNRQEAIFERFVQADLDYKRPHEGSGLGLSIVKAYSHLMKGEVWVESEEGRGSTFNVALPYMPVISNRRIPGDKSIKADRERSHKILIAEDDEISYKLLEKILSDEKFTIIHVWNGEEAVSVMRDDPEISMILMDLRMPLTDGLDAAKKIRQFNKTVKIIAVTVNAFSIDKEIALNSGCDDYVLKPVNKKLLTDIIEKHLYNI